MQIVTIKVILWIIYFNSLDTSEKIQNEKDQDQYWERSDQSNSNTVGTFAQLQKV